MRNCVPLRHLLLLILLPLAAMVATAAEPAPVGATVYLMRMKSGFDLHLANALTSGSVLRVVADPKIADYVFTEYLGPGFEGAMDEMYRQAEETKEAPEDGAAAKDDGDEAAAVRTAVAVSGAVRSSSFGRAEGTLFLVRRSDRMVVWSTFLRRNDTRAPKLDNAAKEVAKRLRKSMKQSDLNAGDSNP